MKIIKRLISILICAALSFSLLSTNAFAMNNHNNPINSPQNICIDEIEDGYVFTEKANDKSVAIITSNLENIIAISIIYISNPNIVHQWIISDYPMDNFSQNSFAAWENIISCAENNLNEASLVEISIDEIDENTPSPLNSTGADLAKDLRGIVGYEYSNRYTNRSRIMDGHTYRLYETMEFSFTKGFTLSWKNGFTIASVLVSIISVAATSANVSLLCGILGIATSIASTVLPAGKVNKYSCMVLYTRYVTVDYGSKQYGHAYKFRIFDGYEDADLNSTGRAHVFPNTKDPMYDANQSEEYFNNGIFNEAYNAYNNIF